MKELELLLEEDPRCSGGYEFLHYKECQDLKFGDTVLKRLQQIESQTTKNVLSQARSAEVVIDSVKKNL